MRKTEATFALIAALIIAIAVLDRVETAPRLNIQEIQVDSINNIVSITDSMVVPVLYDTLITRSFVTVEEQKKLFIDQILPAILIVRFQFENKSWRVNRILRKIEQGDSLRLKDQIFVDSLMTRFRSKTPEGLLMKLKPHPTSLVLAQAAVESGWGSSRFAREGNNLFGIWTTANDPNVLKSLYDRDEQSIFVKKYSNVAESIDHYFLTLGRNNAYRNFRIKRYDEVDVFQLIDELNKYSERGTEYTELLKKMVEWNDFQKYDSYQIHPDYIIVDTVFEKLMKKLKGDL